MVRQAGSLDLDSGFVVGTAICGHLDAWGTDAQIPIPGVSRLWHCVKDNGTVTVVRTYKYYLMD